jgi:hypothetical protein
VKERDREKCKETRHTKWCTYFGITKKLGPHFQYFIP